MSDYKKAVQAMKWLSENTFTHYIDDESGKEGLQNGLDPVLPTVPVVESVGIVGKVALPEQSKWGHCTQGILLHDNSCGVLCGSVQGQWDWVCQPHNW